MASCSVCKHKQVKTIDAQIKARLGWRKMAKLFAVTEEQLMNHKAHMGVVSIGKALTKAGKAHGKALATTEHASIAEQLAAMASRLSILSTAAVESGNLAAGVSALREIRETLSQLHEMMPEEHRDINITVKYADQLLDPQLREIGLNIMARIPSESMWRYFEEHMKMQLPQAYAAVRSQYDNATEEEKREFVSELKAADAKQIQ